MRSSRGGAGVTTEVEIDYGQVDDAMKAAKREIRGRTKAGMKRAADVAVEPRVRRGAALFYPGIVSAAITTRATSREAYVTTRGPKVVDRIAGLLEFGGVVSTQIQPKREGQTGLPVGGAGSDLIRYSVNAPRHYTGKRVLRREVAASVGDFESILLDYVVDAFDPIPHVPK